ncbi:MAG: hypothetical protein QNJ46_36115, partial [Leptolyngbyaceae cyanobacterium MO_188.B28]|nr:hypothetical protein [Leptolyngbyaceae cyanobacterium MO_188.B28]
AKAHFAFSWFGLPTILFTVLSYLLNVGLCFIQPDPWVLQEPRDLNPVQLAHPITQPGRERLRHLIIGSPERVQSVIKSLHVLNYAEQHLWSQLITIPASGILITPEQGEALSYLMRDRQVS